MEEVSFVDVWFDEFDDGGVVEHMYCVILQVFNRRGSDHDEEDDRDRKCRVVVLLDERFVSSGSSLLILHLSCILRL